MKVLITGGAGFIGSHLADAWIAKGHQVFIVDNLITGQKENISSSAVFWQMDIQDESLSSLCEKEKIDLVYHLAAQIDVRLSVIDPVADARVNILGSLNVMKSAKACGARKIIFSSTGGAIYGDTEVIPTPETHPAVPMSPYGIAKFSVENYLRFYHQSLGLPYTILRFANVYGPRQNFRGEAGVVAIFADKMLKNEVCRINGDGNQTRDYVYVKDVVRGLVSAGEIDYCGAINIATGIETTVNQIFDNLKINLNYQLPAEYSAAKAGEQLRSCLDITLASHILTWRPEISLADGIRMTAESFR